MSEKAYCRTCCFNQQLCAIFDDVKTSEKRSKELFLVTGVVIEYNDDYSQLICKPCNSIVKDSLKLRTQSQETDRKLKTQNICTPGSKPDIINTVKPSQTNGRKKVKLKQEVLIKEKIFTDNKRFNNVNKLTEPNIKQKNKKKFNISDEDTKLKNKRNINNKQSIDNDECINDTKEIVKSKKIKNVHNIVNENKKTIEEVDIKTAQQEILINHLNKTDKVNSVDNKNEVEAQKSALSLDKAEIEINSNESVKAVKCKRKRLTKEEVQKYMSLAEEPGDLEEGAVRCALCRVLLRQRRFFISHARTHFEPEHVCESCGKRFTSRSALRYHSQRVHGAARRLACARCEYTCVERAALLNHSRAVHTGERPYECDSCGDTFRARATLVQHMRTHFGAYDVQCERCPARFRSRSELASHAARVHLMLYTYYCYLCPGKYKAVGTVKNHLVRVHNVPRDRHPPIRFTKTRRSSNEERSN